MLIEDLAAWLAINSKEDLSKQKLNTLIYYAYVTYLVQYSEEDNINTISDINIYPGLSGPSILELNSIIDDEITNIKELFLNKDILEIERNNDDKKIKLLNMINKTYGAIDENTLQSFVRKDILAFLKSTKDNNIEFFNDEELFIFYSNIFNK